MKKYYQFPFSIFYKHKLKMIKAMLQKNKTYGNILDFGGGEPQIFNKELRKHAITVHCADSKDDINTAIKYDVIVCASILEFVWLPTTMPVLRAVLKPNGMLLVASPMDTWLTRTYFRLINDNTIRSSHEEILSMISRYFHVAEYHDWLGLYFSCKARHK